MKIVEVRNEIFGDAHLVELVDESGVVGIGQSAAWAYPAAVRSIVEAFRPVLLGSDPRRREHLWHHMYRMGPFRGSFLMAAISAVDIALWDLVAKVREVPIHDMLGGAVRDRLRLHLLLGAQTEDDLVAEAKEGLEEGFTALKFDPLPRDYHSLTMPELIRRTRAVIAAVRDVAPDTDLILEMHRKLTPAQALQVGQSAREFRVLFWEDPLQIDTITKQTEIAAAVGLPIALGERNHTIWEFEELLAPGAVQFIRPDIGLAGGFSHLRKIAAVAEAHHATVVLHNFLGPLLTAASVQLGAAIPNFLLQEYQLKDEHSTAGIVVQPLERQGGYLPIPDRPGLGVELAPDPAPVELVGRAIEDIPFRTDGSVAFSV